ncbi:MAG: tipN, partial [Caulobacteraceae bacterium]|nr:tipN [Caulobacteraceae bacterium]
PRAEPPPPVAPAPARPDSAPPAGRTFGLRRLQLNAGKPAPTTTGPMDWDDLADDAPLDLDSPVMPAAEAETLSLRMIDSVRRMGVDPNALLPRPRIEEAAQALTRGDASAARAVVRRVAPAAVRSVSRRVMSDPALRAEAEAYVRETGRLLQDHARTGDPAVVLNRLASDGGRTFMLLDAAVGDLA